MSAQNCVCIRKNTPHEKAPIFSEANALFSSPANVGPNSHDENPLDSYLCLSVVLFVPRRWRSARGGRNRNRFLRLPVLSESARCESPFWYRFLSCVVIWRETDFLKSAVPFTILPYTMYVSTDVLHGRAICIVRPHSGEINVIIHACMYRLATCQIKYGQEFIADSHILFRNFLFNPDVWNVNINTFVCLDQFLLLFCRSIFAQWLHWAFGGAIWNTVYETLMPEKSLR